MELRNSESSKRYVHVTRTLRARDEYASSVTKVGIVKMPPVSPILNHENTDVAFIYDAVTIRTMTQIWNRDDSISSLNVCWVVLRCDDHTGIFTCDGCARDPYFYVPAETQTYVIKLSCSRKVLAASGD